MTNIKSSNEEKMMPSNASNPGALDARVQVLTAEVRTLVVGSRQVTMSVFNQLDSVPPNEIEPFGRVSPGSDQWSVSVIGRHGATGALVRSNVPRHPERLFASGMFPTVANTYREYSYWDKDADAERQRQRLAKIAARWVELDLIVLAGLR